ncbi:uncharacterized protein LOC121383765 [Gigantopelta aegis]|uniref:uncharacterized protein LOC121383765 n=1 Tax=Gigantopelta aegis TaxID=1735272 RepID=UPI001B88B1F8|nr:uncharacterized protein LOC121383765 [Gigantopelta aegis]
MVTRILTYTARVRRVRKECALLVPSCLTKNTIFVTLENSVMQAKKQINSSLEALKKVSESHTEYKSKLQEQNTKLDKMHEVLMQGIDEHSSKLVVKVKQSSTKLKSLVEDNVAKQKAKREEQIALVDKSEELKAEHVLYCQQALSFARDVEFIEMAKSLENKGKSLMEDLKVLDLQVHDVLLDTDAYENLEKSIGQISIHEADSWKPSYGYPSIQLTQSAVATPMSLHASRFRSL